MRGFYRFPAMARLKELSAEAQAVKIREEADEAFNALCDGLWDCDTGEPRVEMGEADRTAYGMELMDVIHAAETALRMEFSDAEVDGLRMALIRKNQRRGYYGEESWLTARHDLPAGL